MHKFFIRTVCVVLLLGMTSHSMAQDDNTYAYTYHQPSGNRVVDGHGTFPDVTQIDHALGSVPMWLVGVMHDDMPQWVVVDVNGRATRLIPGVVALDLGALPPGTPPLVRVNSEGVGIEPPPEDASPLSHPIPAENGLLYIANNGDFGLLIGDLDNRLAINAMLDARMVVSAQGLVAVYSDPTTERYTHGIMGDDLEAASISIIDFADGAPLLANTITLPGTAVFEGLSPIWADVDGDGEDDLIATVSDNGLGAQVITMKKDGTPIASGPAIGQSHRWRHQIAWARIGENGEAGLSEVLTPHIGGVVGFFALSGENLQHTAVTEGYTSHVINTRNLDMAVVGDFNGDGQMEVAIPTQDRMRIAGLQIQGESFAEVWSLPLDGRLSSNLAAITLPDGSLALAAGTEAGTVRMWLVP